MAYKTVELTPEQDSAWRDTMNLLSWTCPGFRHLWYKLLANNNGKHVAVMTPDCPGGIACTDGANIIINPDKFFEYNLRQRVFIAVHEIVHNVYNDVQIKASSFRDEVVTCSDGKQFPYNDDIMNKAMDYRINALLVESRIGVMPPDALYDPKIAEGKDSIFDIYGKVYKQDQSNGGPGSQGPGKGNAKGQNGFDPNGPAAPGASAQPNQPVPQRNPQQWAVELAQARNLESMKGQGRLPGALQHMFDEILEPKIPWTDHIETICNRTIGTGGVDWKRPDPNYIGRDLYLPNKAGRGAGWLVIWGDTSGSIGKRDLDKYLGELAGVIEQLDPQRMTILWGDAAIGQVDEVTDVADIHNIKARGVGGGGGTDITPAFDWIAEQRGEIPDMFIGMTDGGFSFPDKPQFPIIWANVSKGANYPYGEVVDID